MAKLLADEHARGKKLPMKRKTASLFGLLSSSEGEKESKKKKSSICGLLSSSDGERQPRKKREVYLSKSSDAEEVAARFAGATQGFGDDAQGIPVVHSTQQQELVPEAEAETQQSQPWLHATKPKRKATATVTSSSAAADSTLPGIPVPPSHPPPSYSESMGEFAHSTTSVAGFTVNEPVDKLSDM